MLSVSAPKPVGWEHGDPCSRSLRVELCKVTCPNGNPKIITQFRGCAARDPKGPIFPTVFGNTARDPHTRRAYLINYCLHSCHSLRILFLLAGIRKSKQSTLIVLFWGSLRSVNIEAGGKPTSRVLGLGAGRRGRHMSSRPLW